MFKATFRTREMGEQEAQNQFKTAAAAINAVAKEFELGAGDDEVVRITILESNVLGEFRKVFCVAEMGVAAAVKKAKMANKRRMDQLTK